MNESESIIDHNKESDTEKTNEANESNTHDTQNNEGGKEVSVNSELGVQQSTNDSQSIDELAIPVDVQIVNNENERNELQDDSTQPTNQNILPIESESARTLQQQYIQTILDMEKKRIEWRKERRRQYHEKHEMKKKNTLELSKEVLERKRRKSEYAKERYRRLHKKQQNALTQEQIAQQILDRERKRRESINKRQQRYRDRMLLEQINEQPSTSGLQDKKLQDIIDRYEKRTEKENHSIEENMKKVLERQICRDERRREVEKECQQRYRDKLLLNKLSAETNRTTIQNKKLQNILDRCEKRREKQNDSQEEIVQKMIESYIKLREKNNERQRRYYQRKRQSKNTRNPQTIIIDKDQRRRELGRERMRRFRERQRENFTRQQAEFRQRIQAEQNATVSQVQNTLDVENEQVVCLEQSVAGQSIVSNAIFIKQEFEDENAFIIPDSMIVPNNNESDSSAMEVTQEMTPTFVESVVNDEIDIKEEDVEAPTINQNFVFVSCADTVALNEATIRDTRIPCPCCGKLVQQMNLHKEVCEAKFVYFCIFCSTMIKRQCNLKKHIKMKHADEIANAPEHLNSVDKVYREIVANRKELNVSSPGDRDRAIRELKKANKAAKVVANGKELNVSSPAERDGSIFELQNANETANLEKEICIVTENRPELIIPDLIETHQELRPDAQILKMPVVMLSRILEIPAVLQMQNVTQHHSVTTQVAKDKNVENLANKSFETSQKSNNVPMTIIHENIDPVFVNVPSQGVVFRKQNANISKFPHFYCNECAYKSTKKQCLQRHITTYHGDKLNLKWHTCNRCRKSFQYRDHWKAHKAICNVKAYYYCLFCPKSLLFNSILKHVQTEHRKEVENKTTDEINDLLVAKKEAVESMAVDNEEADTRFTYFYDLRSAGKERRSDPACDVDETSSAQLNLESQSSQSKKADTPKANYVHCDECFYKTSTKSGLINHMRKCLNDKLNLKWHKCNICDKKFQYKEYLIAHKATCKEKYYFCPFCTTYMLYRNVLKHIKLQHAKEIENKSTDEIKSLLEATKEAVNNFKVDFPSQSPEQNQESNPIQNVPVVEEETVETSTVDERKAVEAKPKPRPNSKSKLKKTVETSTVDEQKAVGAKPKPRPNSKSKLKKTVETSTVDERKVVEAKPRPRPNSRSKLKKTVETSTVDERKVVEAKPRPRPNSRSTFIYCNHCDYKTFRKDHLVRHIGGVHSAKSNMQYRSNKRKKSIKKNADMADSKKIFIRKVKYTCLYCPVSLTCLKNVKRHIVLKHASEISEKSIDVVMQEVYAKQAVVYETQTSWQTRIKHPEIDPSELDVSSFEYVPVYCFKCKHIKTSFSKRKSRLRNCQDCGAQMIYLCLKCKEMHSVQFHILVNHWKQCTVNERNAEFNLDNLKVYSCSECSYVCTHKFKYESHLVRSKHKANADYGIVEGNVDGIDAEEMEMYDEAKFVVRRCVTDYSTMTRRYCLKCDKIVTEEMQPRRNSTKESCKVCGTRFRLQCVKCNSNYNSYISIRYHLNSRCYPGDYKCIKCDRRSCNWHLMQKHYLNSHTNKKPAILCEYCSFRTKHKTNFYMHLTTMHPEQSKDVVPENIKLKMRVVDFVCDICNFSTKRKGTIKVHLQNVHGTKRHKCQICKFRTRYEASLKRHYSIRHKNYY